MGSIPTPATKYKLGVGQEMIRCVWGAEHAGAIPVTQTKLRPGDGTGIHIGFRNQILRVRISPGPLINMGGNVPRQATESPKLCG